MGEQSVSQGGGEMALELAAVVGEHRFDGEGEYRLDELEELCRGGAGVAAGGPGPSEVRMQIGTGDDVAAMVLGAQLDAVQGHAVARALGPEVFRLAQPRAAYRLGLAYAALGARARAHLVRRIGNEPADGARARAGQMVGGSKRQEQQLQLLLAQVRMRAAQSPDLAHHRARPLPSAPPLRGRATGHQRREVATLGAPFRSPAVQGASAYRVGFLRGGQPVALPEAEYFQATLGTFGDHAPA